MKTSIPGKLPRSMPVPARLADRVESQLRSVAKKLGLSREEALLLSLERGLDKLGAPVLPSQQGKQSS